MKIFSVKRSDGRKAYVKVDDEDAHLLRQFVWRINDRSATLWRYAGTRKMCKTFAQEMGVAQPAEVALHKNGDALDYRRANLHVERSRAAAMTIVNATRLMTNVVTRSKARA